MTTRWDLMLRELRTLISFSTPSHPAARVWKTHDLTQIISHVRTKHRETLLSTFPSAKDVIARMTKIGWLHPITVTSPTSKTPDIYLVDMEAGKEDMPDARELLQGLEPKGVLCHFGALEFHQLTTQTAAFYHIAKHGARDRTPFMEENARIREPITSTPESNRKPRDPLGTLLFEYEGTPCYSTRRDFRLMPGVKKWTQGPRTTLRLTTLEQTLLDTLMQPLRCGGEAVAFEAWETGISRWKPAQMEKLLAAIDREDMERRVGAMLEALNIAIPAELNARLERRKQQHRESDHSHQPPIPLLHGFTYTRTSDAWGITLP